MESHYNIEERDGTGRLRRLRVAGIPPLIEEVDVHEEPNPRFSSELLKKVFLPAGFPHSVSSGNSFSHSFIQLGS